MKNLFTLLVALCFALSASASAESVLTDVEKMDNKQLLKHLDQLIEAKVEFRNAYIASIDSLKKVAAAQSTDQRADTYKKIFQSYSKLQSDSAMAYLDRMERLPRYDADPDFHDWVRTGRAEIYGVMGMYSSAIRVLNGINVSDNSAEVVLYYYQICRTVYGWMADFGEVSDQTHHYRDLTQHYRDSIMSVQKPSIDRSIVEADRCQFMGDLAKAKEICEATIAKGDKLQRIYLYVVLADVAHAEGRVKDEIRYLAMCSIYDVQRGATEYSALPRLALLLSAEGDNERAYDYLICTMDDASFCKARLRSIEASTVFPFIERYHNQKQQESYRWAASLGIVFATFTLLLIFGLFFLHRRNVQLALTRKQLADAVEAEKKANETLRGLNTELVFSNKVKETYVARYLERCRSYIDKMNDWRVDQLHRVKDRKYDELYKLLKSNSLILSEEESFLHDFDEAFLTLFPDFIVHFNALLQPDARVVPKRDEMLNTELRIFALVRLGITDSNRIAHFLNYSLPTIYSYRSRLRNKAVCPKEEFEARVMEC